MSYTHTALQLPQRYPMHGEGQPLLSHCLSTMPTELVSAAAGYFDEELSLCFTNMSSWSLLMVQEHGTILSPLCWQETEREERYRALCSPHLSLHLVTWAQEFWARLVLISVLQLHLGEVSICPAMLGERDEFRHLNQNQKGCWDAMTLNCPDSIQDDMQPIRLFHNLLFYDFWGKKPCQCRPDGLNWLISRLPSCKKSWEFGVHVFIGLHSWGKGRSSPPGSIHSPCLCCCHCVANTESQRSKETNLFPIELTASRDDGKAHDQGNSWPWAAHFSVLSLSFLILQRRR